jgi:hypothetical protein
MKKYSLGKKLSLVMALGVALAGVFLIANELVSSGAVGRLNKDYNIFNMVDESLGTMKDMNDIMGEVGANVSVLDKKLDLLGETNGLLEEQLTVVDRLNELMGGQKPLLTQTNQSISVLNGKLLTTLSGVQGLDPVMGELLASMGSALDLTGAVVGGTSDMVGIAGNISGLFDSTLGYLAAIQPYSLKAKAYMKGDILSRLGEFMPKPAAAAVAASSTQGARKSTPAATGPVQNLTQQLVTGVDQVLDGTVDTVNGLTNNILSPLLDPLKNLLK